MKVLVSASGEHNTSQAVAGFIASGANESLLGIYAAFLKLFNITYFHAFFILFSSFSM